MYFDVIYSQIKYGGRRERARSVNMEFFKPTKRALILFFIFLVIGILGVPFIKSYNGGALVPQNIETLDRTAVQPTHVTLGKAFILRQAIGAIQWFKIDYLTVISFILAVYVLALLLGRRRGVKDNLMV